MRVMEFGNLKFELRPATDEDFDFAWLLYRDLMKPLTEELLEWNELRQNAVVEEASTYKGTSIIVVNESNAGWLQVSDIPSGIYLDQLYILPAMQNHGIGTAIVRQLCDRGRKEGKTLTLEVMKNNRARLFYERLGFRVIRQSNYKLEMRWQEET